MNKYPHTYVLYVDLMFLIFSFVCLFIIFHKDDYVNLVKDYTAVSVFIFTFMASYFLQVTFYSCKSPINMIFRGCLYFISFSAWLLSLTLMCTSDYKKLYHDHSPSASLIITNFVLWLLFMPYAIYLFYFENYNSCRSSYYTSKNRRISVSSMDDELWSVS